MIVTELLYNIGDEVYTIVDEAFVQCRIVSIAFHPDYYNKEYENLPLDIRAFSYYIVVAKLDEDRFKTFIRHEWELFSDTDDIKAYELAKKAEKELDNLYLNLGLGFRDED